MYEETGLKTNVCVCRVCMCACMKNWLRLLCIRVCMYEEPRYENKRVFASCIHVCTYEQPGMTPEECIPKAGGSTLCLHVCMYATHTMHAYVEHSGERCRQQALCLVATRSSGQHAKACSHMMVLMGANMKEFTKQAAHVVYSCVLVCTAHHVCTHEAQRVLQAAGSLPCGD